MEGRKDTGMEVWRDKGWEGWRGIEGWRDGGIVMDGC